MVHLLTPHLVEDIGLKIRTKNGRPTCNHRAGVYSEKFGGLRKTRLFQHMWTSFVRANTQSGSW
jgi:hypothetical protein